MSTIDQPESAPKPRLQTRVPGQWVTVCRALQQDIMSGRLKPRERLVEDEVIARGGATRHAVRRAFDELDRLGLVIRYENRGVQVRDYTPAEIEELYEIRACLERQAAVRYALPAAPTLIAALRMIARDHEVVSRRGQVGELLVLNDRFHETLYRGAGSAALADAIRRYTVATQPIRSRAFPNEALRETAIADHHAMVAAIETGDREGLASLVVEHITRPMRFYIACTFGDGPIEA